MSNETLIISTGLLISGSAYAADNQIYIQQTTTGTTNTQMILSSWVVVTLLQVTQVQPAR